PRGRSGWQTTPTTCVVSCRAVRAGSAISGVPKKAVRTLEVLRDVGASRQRSYVADTFTRPSDVGRTRTHQPNGLFRLTDRRSSARRVSTGLRSVLRLACLVRPGIVRAGQSQQPDPDLIRRKHE